jgi:hypothetical protein
MTSAWTVITDGSAVSAALARWLLRHGDGTIIEARGDSDLAAVVAARKQAAPGARLTVIAAERTAIMEARGDSDLAAVVAARKQTAPSAQLTAIAAERTAIEWLGALPPIDVRTTGADILENRLQKGEPGSEVLQDLLLNSLPVPPKRTKTQGRRRGRPPGRNPFHGSGFEVCSVLLLDPTKEWTARAVAMEIQRTLSLVQRAFGELERRGLLRRLSRGVRIDDPLLLRNELLQAWTEHVGAPRREAQAFIAGKRKGLAGAVFARAQQAGARCIFAGPSAVEGPTALVGDPLTVYCDAQPLECFAGSGFEPATGPRADLAVWTPPERMVFLRPRTVGGHQATNRLVTFLDLAASGSQRHRAAAEAVWQSER